MCTKEDQLTLDHDYSFRLNLKDNYKVCKMLDLIQSLHNGSRY